MPLSTQCSTTLYPQCDALSIGLGNLGVTQFIHIFYEAFCKTAPKWPPDYGPKFINSENQEYDFIVIGAGTAGSVVAGRLSENPRNRVLLLEAGADPPVKSEIPGIWPELFQTESDWSYLIASNHKSCGIYQHDACYMAHGKMLGGSSAMNVMIYARGTSGDFQHWEELGNPGWGWTNVQKYFRRFENFLPRENSNDFFGVGGPLDIRRVESWPNIRKVIFEGAREHGFKIIDDYRDGNWIGYLSLPTTIVNGTRNTPAKAYLQNPRPNLHIIKHAIATKINFDGNKQAVSVNFVYTDCSGREHWLVAKVRKEVAVCAGAIESPKLLMLSGIGPKEQLTSFGLKVISDVRGIGENLQDHTVLPVSFRMRSKPTNTTMSSTLHDDYLERRLGPLATVNIMNMNAFLDINNQSGVYPNIQIHGYYLPIESDRGAMIQSSLLSIGRQLLSYVLNAKELLFQSLSILYPKSRGYIKLQSADYRDKPIVFPNYLAEYEDVQLYIDTIRTLMKLVDTPTFRRNQITLFRLPLPKCLLIPFNTDQYWECYIREMQMTIYHPVGTVKMGPKHDKDACVDSHLRVRGVKGVRVIDASIMPRIVGANTMATTIMIGEKGAEMIKRRWKDD